MSNNFINTPFMQKLYWQVVNDLSQKSYREVFSFNNQYSSHVTESLQTQMISLLFESKRLSVNTRDINDQTLLMWASEGGNYEMVELLLQRHVSINKIDHNNETALFKAVSYNYPSIVKLLLSKGADLGTVNWHAYTPLEQAISKHCDNNVNNLQTIELLLKQHLINGITDDQSDLFRDVLLINAICAKKYDLFYLIVRYRQLARPEQDILSSYLSNPLLPDDPEVINYLFKKDPVTVIRQQKSSCCAIMGDYFPMMLERIEQLDSQNMRSQYDVFMLVAWKLKSSQSLKEGSLSHFEAPAENARKHVESKLKW